MNAECMGANITATELEPTPDIQATMDKIEAENATDPEAQKNLFVELMKTGPSRLITWLGNNEIWVGGTQIGTESGKLTVKTGATQQQAATMEKPGALNWWQAMPDYVRYGVPAIALFMLLRGRK